MTVGSDHVLAAAAPEAGVEASAPPPVAAPRRLTRRRLVLHAVFGVLGVGAMAAMVHSVGPAKLLAVLGRCAVFLPFLVLIEVVRIATEWGGMWWLSRDVRRAVAPLPLFRTHVVAYAVSCVMPAGRAACEGTKAAMIAPYVGGPRAAAIAATNQSLCLFAGALIALACAVGAWIELGSSPVTWGCIVSAVMAILAYAAVQIASRARRLGGFLGRRFEKLRAATASFQDALEDLPVLHVGAASLWFVNRLLQTVQFGLLVYAVGGPLGVGTALVAEGVNVAGGAAGDFIPGQLGATDGAFALAASSLHIAVADAIAVAMVVHFMMLSIALLGALTPLVWRAPPAPVRTVD
ncbi:MAG TPA: lysylphosphatidylglycerol synthase domain-containing protein [Minicystis sp.]|nr:lysylphosphatidylglycerol synthase domain-containing protein [Minicystis sp.]